MSDIQNRNCKQTDLRIRSTVAGSKLTLLKDIDVTNLADGSVLVYSVTSEKWEATTLLEKQTVEGGQY